jgi:anthranilate synthase/aminodeoxychorismate synthase-like glutamine amidotransferase
MIFVLDNYDSFTYNLVQYLGELGAEPLVHRNDELTVEEIERLAPQGIVISPGPGTPATAGVSVPLIRHFSGKLPILGVCLGHQALGEAFGGRVVRADRLMHGKTSPVEHTGVGIFRGVPSPITAMRYHSLIVDPATVPGVLEVTAWSADRPRGSEIMGLQHRTEPVFGVQFHPESVGTDVGKQLVANFLAVVAPSRGKRREGAGSPR